MPDKIVEVPGIGNVAFPDSMSDEQIATAIRNQLNLPEPPDAVAQARARIQQIIPREEAYRADPRLRSVKLPPGVTPEEVVQRENEYNRQSGQFIGTVAGGLLGGSVASNLVAKGAIGTLGKASTIGAGAGLGQLAAEPEKPREALSTAAVGTATGIALSPVAKFIQDLAGKAKAGPLFQAVSEAAGSNQVETSGMLKVAQEAQQLQKAGFTMPRVINRFLARVNSGEPMTFDELRRFEQAAGGRLAPGEAQNIRPQMYAKLSQFADEARKASMQAAGQSGQANTFAEALSQYRAGTRAEKAEEMIKEFALEALKGAAKGIPYGAGATAGGLATYGAYKAYKGKP